MKSVFILHAKFMANEVGGEFVRIYKRGFTEKEKAEENISTFNKSIIEKYNGENSLYTINTESVKISIMKIEIEE